MVDNPRYKLSFRTTNGDMLTVHSHRVLHGRLAFDPASGARHLQDVYMGLRRPNGTPRCPCRHAQARSLVRGSAGMNEPAPTVSFTAMEHGTRADCKFLSALQAQELKRFADRVLGRLSTMDDSVGYQITRLEHFLEAATRAHRAVEDEETVVCVLLHDIGDYLAPANHSEVAAAVLRPYVSEKNHWIVKHHGVFQGVYHYHFTGADPNARNRWKGHPFYQATVDFCANYDQNSFDPKDQWEPLTFFEPMVRRVLAAPRTFERQMPKQKAVTRPCSRPNRAADLVDFHDSNVRHELVRCLCPRWLRSCPLWYS
jgi:predicted HD phosphohydrolase